MEQFDYQTEMELVRRLVDEHNLGKGDDAASNILRQNPHDIDAMIEKITLWFTWGAMEPAEDAVYMVHQLAPESAADLFAQAAGDPGLTSEEKIQLFTRAIEKEPAFERAMFALGKIYFEEKQYERAVQALDQALALAPRHSIALFYAGKAKSLLGDYEGAARNLSDFIKIPGFTDRLVTFSTLAHCFLQLTIQELKRERERSSNAALYEPDEPEF